MSVHPHTHSMYTYLYLITTYFQLIRHWFTEFSDEQKNLVLKQLLVSLQLFVGQCISDCSSVYLLFFVQIWVGISTITEWCWNIYWRNRLLLQVCVCEHSIFHLSCRVTATYHNYIYYQLRWSQDFMLTVHPTVMIVLVGYLRLCPFTSSPT